MFKIAPISQTSLSTFGSRFHLCPIRHCWKASDIIEADLPVQKTVGHTMILAVTDIQSQVTAGQLLCTPGSSKLPCMRLFLQGSALSACIAILLPRWNQAFPSRFTVHSIPLRALRKHTACLCIFTLGMTLHLCLEMKVLPNQLTVHVAERQLLLESLNDGKQLHLLVKAVRSNLADSKALRKH